MEEQTRNMKTVFTVVERGQGKSIWVRVGTGFLNKDGSWNLHLDAVPTNGKLQVRDWEPYERRGDAPGPVQDGAQPPPRPRPKPQASPSSPDAPF
jgi:hypothetical protein